MGHATVAALVILLSMCCSCCHGYVMATVMPGKGYAHAYVTMKSKSPMDISVQWYKESENGYWGNNKNDDDDDDDNDEDDDDNDEDDEGKNYEKSHNIFMVDKKTAIRFEEDKANIVQKIKSALRSFYKGQ